MKLVYAREMTHEQGQNLRLCVSRYSIGVVKEDAISIIINQITLMEAGVQVLDRRFPVPGSGNVDLVAVDQRKRLLLIEFSSILDVKGLSNLFLQSDWMTENLDVLKHIYPDRILDNSIRLWHLSGKILPEAKSLLKRLNNNTLLELFTYDCVGFSSERWLIIQPYLVNRESYLAIHQRDTEGNTKYPFLQSSGQARYEQRDTRYKLTQEEIDDFLSDDGYLQENAEAVDEEDEITYVGTYFK